MARTSLSYLDDQDDPLNDLLGGGGEPAVPDAPPQPAQQDAPPQQEPDQSQPEPTLEQSLLAPQQAPERVYTEPDPIKMRDSYSQPSASGTSKDPELEAAYRKAQLDALQHGGFDDNKYGVGEAVRDNGAALIASILDIGFNKGRGLGGIVGATAQEVGRQEQAREAKRKDAREFALKAREKGDSALQQQRLQYLMDSLAERANAHGQTQQRFDTTRSDKLPDSAVYRAGVQKAGDTKTAQLNAAHALNDQTAGDRAAITTATTQAGLDTQHDNAPRTGADAAAQRAAVDQAGADVTHANAPIVTADAAARAGAEATATIAGQRAGQSAGRPIPAGFHTEDAARWQDVTSDPIRYREALADTQMANQLQSSADQLSDIRKKYGPQALPSAGSGEYNALHLAVLGAANRVIGQAGTVNAGERQLMESMIPGIKPNWGDLFGWLKDSNLNAQQLEGFAKGLQTVLNARASSYGLGLGDAPQQPSAANAMPQVPGNTMPGYSHDLSTDNLGTTRGRVPRVPRAGAKPAANDGMVTISFGGQSQRVPAAQAKAIQALEPGAEISP